MKEKTYVEDVSRSIYDIRNEEKDMYKVSRGKSTTRNGCAGSVWNRFRFIMKRR